MIKKMLVICLILMVFSCTSNKSIVIENRYNNVEVRINDTPSKVFLEDYSSIRTEDNISYFIFDEELMIKFGQADLGLYESCIFTKPGYEVGFYEDGKLESCYLANVNYINIDDDNRLPIVEGSRIVFHSNGLLASLFPSENIALENLVVKKGEELTFYDNGNLRSCVNASKFIYKKSKDPLPPDSVIFLDSESSKVVKIFLSDDYYFDDIKMKGGTYLYFYPDIYTLAYFVPVEDIMIGEIEINGGKPVFLYKPEDNVAKIARYNTPGNERIKADTDVFLFSDGSPARFTINKESMGFIEAKGDIISYLYKDKSPLFVTDNQKMRVFFDEAGNRVITYDEINKIKKLIEYNGDSYDDLLWKWTGYDVLYDFHEEIDY